MKAKTEIEMAGLDRDKNIDDLAATNDLGRLSSFLDELPGKSQNGVGVAIQLRAYDSLREY
jgi:hypothetical protein